MSWLELWLMALLATGSRGCIKCSQSGMAMVKDFKDNYLHKKLRRDSALRSKLQKFMDEELEQLPHYFLNKGTFKGIIDEYSLETLVSHFKRSLNTIKENEFEGEQLFNEVVWSLQNLKATFEQMMPGFQKIYCSNECESYSAGYMVYVLYSCFSCQMNYYTCRKDFRCGERTIEVEMDEDLILDCGLTWHKANHGSKEYFFFRMMELLAMTSLLVFGKSEQLMTSGTDSFLVKKVANLNDTGKYRCKMNGVEGHLSSELDFRVKVVPSVGRTTWFPRPPMTTLDAPLTLSVASRAQLPKEDWTPWIVIGITGGALLIFVVGFIWFYIRAYKKEKKEKEEEKEEEEEEEYEGGDSETELVET